VALASLGDGIDVMVERFAEFVDDPDGIPDEAILYRRVDWDKIGGIARAVSGVEPSLNGNCFSDYPESEAGNLGFPGPCMSVGVSMVLDQLELPVGRLLQGFEGYGLASMRAGDLRVLKRADGTPCPHGVMLAPTDSEPWHGIVFDETTRPRKGGVQKAVCRIAKWEIPLLKP
jgi:hypothetical protein